MTQGENTEPKIEKYIFLVICKNKERKRRRGKIIRRIFMYIRLFQVIVGINILEGEQTIKYISKKMGEMLIVHPEIDKQSLLQNEYTR